MNIITYQTLFAASGLDILSRLSPHISTIDLSDNDIYDLEAVIEPLTKLQTLQSLVLAGNPCAVTNILISTLRCAQMALSSIYRNIKNAINFPLTKRITML